MNISSFTFFGVNPLPQPAVANEILTRIKADDMKNDANYKFLCYMDLTMNPVPAEESAVVDFAVCLLTLLDYAPRTRIIRRRSTSRLPSAESNVIQQPMSVVDEDDILLLVQEDKRHKERKDPEPQLVTQAIAAFQTNNTRRTRVFSQVVNDAMVMPGITLVGSSPTFYKIPVTKEFAQGQFPAAPIVVYAHLPAVPRPARLSEGMKPLENRWHILACCEAFRQFVN